jgi:hypothetical protein
VAVSVNLAVAIAKGQSDRGARRDRHSRDVADTAVGVVVLVISAVLEGASWRTAHRQLRREADARHLDVGKHLATSGDPSAVTVFVEDSAESSVADGVASTLIGALLVVVATLQLDMAGLVAGTR